MGGIEATEMIRNELPKEYQPIIIAVTGNDLTIEESLLRISNAE